MVSTSGKQVKRILSIPINRKVQNADQEDVKGKRKQKIIQKSVVADWSESDHILILTYPLAPSPVLSDDSDSDEQHTFGEWIIM